MAGTVTAPRRHARPARPRSRAQAPALPPHVSEVDYKDVALLRTLVSDRGKVRSRRVTGLTPRQQRAVARAVKNAREMALLPYGSR